MEALTLPLLQQQGVPQGQGLHPLLTTTTTLHSSCNNSIIFSAIRYLLTLVSQVDHKQEK